MNFVLLRFDGCFMGEYGLAGSFQISFNICSRKEPLRSMAQIFNWMDAVHVNHPTVLNQSKAMKET